MFKITTMITPNDKYFIAYKYQNYKAGPFDIKK